MNFAAEAPGGTLPGVQGNGVGNFAEGAKFGWWCDILLHRNNTFHLRWERSSDILAKYDFQLSPARATFFYRAWVLNQERRTQGLRGGSREVRGEGEHGILLGGSWRSCFLEEAKTPIWVNFCINPKEMLFPGHKVPFSSS